MNNQVTIGIDNRDGVYYVARVEQHTGRPDIKALIRFDADHFNGHHLLEGNQIIISIPDNQTMIKKVVIPTDENKYMKVRFELETALGDNPQDFVYDIIQTKLENYFIGLTIRKELTDKLIEPFVKHNGDLKFSTGGVMRAVALARGFFIYCQQSGGDFGAIIDFGENSASIAFYYKQEIVDIDSLPLQTQYYQNPESFQKVIIELKTLFNYKLSALLEKGISVPLSKLFVIGESIDEASMHSLSKNLKINISHPEINRGFITDRDKNKDIPLDKYLVALGLTAV